MVCYENGQVIHVAEQKYDWVGVVILGHCQFISVECDGIICRMFVPGFVTFHALFPEG